MHPISSEDKIKREVLKRDLEYTEHFLEDVEPERPKITFEMVEEFLGDSWEDLLAIKYKPDRYDNHRYNLCFRKSSRYYVLMAISFSNGYVNLITAFPAKQTKGEPEKLVNQYGVRER